MKIDKTIKVLVMDVDGTLTDGGLYIGAEGEVIKRFHVKDGYAIHDLLPQMGILPIVITGRNSEIVKRRCEELGISRLVQGSIDKVRDLQKILDEETIAWEEVAYIGDDLNDYPCMELVGIRGCPCDAAAQIKEIADYITESTGGNGAVREFVEWIGRQNEDKP